MKWISSPSDCERISDVADALCSAASSIGITVTTFTDCTGHVVS